MPTKRKRIKTFMSESKEKIDSAENSIEFGFFKSATHDIYFAAENAARALLLALEGNIPSNKNKIWMKIMNYQRKNLIKKFSRADIDKTYRYRRKADYVETRERIVITKDGVISALDISKRFVNEVESLLKEKRYL